MLRTVGTQHPNDRGKAGMTAQEDEHKLDAIRRKSQAHRSLEAAQERLEASKPLSRGRPSASARTYGNANLVLALTGSGLLFLGVFLPILQLPFAGSVTYFNNGKGDGVVIAVLAGAGILLALARRYRIILVTGSVATGLVLVDLVNVMNRIDNMKQDLGRDLDGNPFRGLVDVATASVQLQWGWAVLLVGALLTIGAAVVRAKE